MQKILPKVLVIGQGLAGSVLAMQLLESGVSIHVVGQELPGAASAVAAGVFNPLTGRKPVETWLAGTIFPYLQAFYPRLEATLGARFYFPMPNLRPFHSAEERATAETWRQTPAVARWGKIIDAEEAAVLNPSGIARMPFGALVVQEAGYVEVSALITSVRTYLKAGKLYEDHLLEEADLLPRSGGYEFMGVLYHKVIFCTGWWGSLPGLAPLKGEILRVQATSLPSLRETSDLFGVPKQPGSEDTWLLNFVLNRNGYLAPRPDGTWWAGSTYQHHFQDDGPTDAAREDILARVGRNVAVPLQVLEHRAGIRPSVKDRRPILGFLNEDARLGHFNGLGTKGVSLAPYMAKLFCEHIRDAMPLPHEIDVNRFQS